jgi:acylphosphatase
MSDLGRLDATVHGRVQGVGFRWFVQRAARRLALQGWTANQSDGSVRVIAEGPPAALEELIAELGRGPDGADVERVDAQHGPPTGEFGAFEIRARGHRGD